MSWPKHPHIEIHCEIKHVKLADKLSYEALSYTWGDPYETPEIRIRDTSHSVRRNLWEALWSLSRSKSISFLRYLWGDALCINQNDTKERNHQVTLIGRIYSQAKTVLVWLGRGNPELSTAILFLSAIAHRSKEPGSFNPGFPGKMPFTVDDRIRWSLTGDLCD
jgi:hypothetical protein